MRLSILTFTALLASCSPNAVLEVELELPPRTDELRFALVQARDGTDATYPFDVAWSPVQLSMGVPLTESPSFERVSIVSETEPELLRLKVRFCTTARCDAPGSAESEAWFELEHPLYLGAATDWSFRFAGIPTFGQTHPCAGRTSSMDVLDSQCADVDIAEPSLTVPLCEIRGCTEGEPANFCYAIDPTRHFCAD